MPLYIGLLSTFRSIYSMVGFLRRRLLETCKRLRVKVGKSSTIRVVHNVYSVNSRLIGETVDVRNTSRSGMAPAV